MQLVPVSILVASTAALTTRAASAFLAVAPTTNVSSVSTITFLNAAEYLNRWVPADENASTVAFGLLLPRTTTTLEDPVEDFDRHYGVAGQQNTDLQQQQQQQPRKGSNREAETTTPRRQRVAASPTQQQLDELPQHPSLVELLASVIIGATQFGLLVARWGKNLTMLLVCFIYLQTIL